MRRLIEKIGARTKTKKRSTPAHFLNRGERRWVEMQVSSHPYGVDRRTLRLNLQRQLVSEKVQSINDLLGQARKMYKGASAKSITSDPDAPYRKSGGEAPIDAIRRSEKASTMIKRVLGKAKVVEPGMPKQAEEDSKIVETLALIGAGAAGAFGAKALYKQLVKHLKPLEPLAAKTLGKLTKAQEALTKVRVGVASPQIREALKARLGAEHAAISGIAQGLKGGKMEKIREGIVALEGLYPKLFRK
jgi:hypothetical protein